MKKGAALCDRDHVHVFSWIKKSLTDPLKSSSDLSPLWWLAMHRRRRAPGQRAIALKIAFCGPHSSQMSPCRIRDSFGILLIRKPADPLRQRAQRQYQLGARAPPCDRGFGGGQRRHDPEGGQQAETMYFSWDDSCFVAGTLDGATTPGVYLTGNHTTCWHCRANMIACQRLSPAGRSRCPPQTPGEFVVSLTRI